MHPRGAVDAEGARDSHDSHTEPTEADERALQGEADGQGLQGEADGQARQQALVREEEAIEEEEGALEARLESIRRRMQDRERHEGRLPGAPQAGGSGATDPGGNRAPGSASMVETVIDDDDGGMGEGSGVLPYLLLAVLLGAGFVMRNKLRPKTRGRSPRRYDRRSRA